MTVRKTNSAESLFLEEVPGQLSDSDVLVFIHTKDIDWKYIVAIKRLTNFNDEVISDWLNVSVKTFRSYQLPKNKFKENMKERVLLLLSLIKQGIQLFGNREHFDHWLNSANFFFDNQSPLSYLNTVTGIRFVSDRLRAMEYGDNV